MNTRSHSGKLGGNMKKPKKDEGTSFADAAYENMKRGKYTWLAKFVRDLVERSIEFKCGFDLNTTKVRKKFVKTSKRKNAKQKFDGYDALNSEVPICSFCYKDYKKGVTTAFVGGDMENPRVRPPFLCLLLDGISYKKESSFNNIVESFCRLIHEHGYEEWGVENRRKEIVIEMQKTRGKLH